ncbi:60S ribosome subunit biogenesis protein NIP7 homolog [Hyalella azteca]|uniref:60S ribosome subunit biogenesis protein NIP7 homolog n=1 Tax=Hyalella azteca TaxID=294128 RepID=A0A8B7PIB3_HYAAZ|nr:60S ribosome subunit biogenesis protein NIP7 homolog [Hyalella azteca]
MRPLSDTETKVMFKKIMKYIGERVKLLIKRPDGNYCFRIHNNRVFYVSEKHMKLAATMPKDMLVSFGVIFGKFTKTKKLFFLHITALDYLAPYAQSKVWIKESSEQHFLYANHVMKSDLARITDGTPRNAGVIICNSKDVPLGFGVAAKSALECRHAGPVAIVAFHQADLGEYIRDEDKII